MAEIPIIETERLVLRPHRLADFENYAAMWRDPVVVRFIGGKARTREECWLRFLRHAGMWHHMGFGYWAVEERSSAAVIGEGGFHELRRDMTPSLEGTLETGWAFWPSAHGKGFATEAVGAMLAWAAAERPGAPVTCFIDPANEASLRVASRVGFVERGQGAYGGEPVIVFDYPVGP